MVFTVIQQTPTIAMVAQDVALLAVSVATRKTLVPHLAAISATIAL